MSASEAVISTVKLAIREALRGWIRQVEIDGGQRPGTSTEDHERSARRADPRPSQERRNYRSSPFRATPATIRNLWATCDGGPGGRVAVIREPL
jgi:hypothetical protein